MQEAARLLNSLSYRNVLRRGYAVVRNATDQAVDRAAALSAGEAVSLEFADGRVDAVTAGAGRQPKKSSAKPRNPEDQGDLF